MDKLHREHEFIQSMWKFMKTCEQQENRDEAFWNWAHETAEKLSRNYGNFSFVNEWIPSYLKYLDENKREEAS